LNPADAAIRSTLEGDIFPPAWLVGPEFVLQAEWKWPTDLPWMVINDEIRAARPFTATQIVTTDWSSVHLTQENIPALRRLKDDFLISSRNVKLNPSARSYVDFKRRSLFTLLPPS